MKKLALLFSLLLLPSLTLAELDESSEPEWRVVEYGQIDLAARADDGGVVMEWSAFPGEGLEWYKVIKSVSNDNLVYPEADVIGVEGPEGLNFVDENAERNAYYRVCAVTTERGRSCSNVVWVEVQDKRETDQKIKYNDYRTKTQAQREKMEAMKNAHVEKKEAYEVKKEENKDAYEAKKVEKQEAYEAKKEERQETRNEQLYARLESWLDKVENRLKESDMTGAQKIEKIKKIQARLYEWEKGSEVKMKVVDFLDKTFMAWIAAWEQEVDVEDIGGFLDDLLED